jgi:hypothetical protein
MNRFMKWLADYDFNLHKPARFKHPAYIEQYSYRYAMAEINSRGFI